MERQVIHDHVQLSSLQGKQIKNVIYPENTAQDVILNTENNANVDAWETLQDIIDNIGILAFYDTIIDDGNNDEGTYQKCTATDDGALLVVSNDISDSDFNSNTQIKLEDISKYVEDAKIGEYYKIITLPNNLTWSSLKINNKMVEIMNEMSEELKNSIDQLNDSIDSTNTNITTTINNNMSVIDNTLSDLDTRTSKIEKYIKRIVTKLYSAVLTGDPGKSRNTKDRSVQYFTINGVISNYLDLYLIDDGRQYIYCGDIASNEHCNEHLLITQSYEKCESGDDGAMKVIDSDSDLPTEDTMPLWFVEGDVSDIKVGEYVREMTGSTPDNSLIETYQKDTENTKGSLLVVDNSVSDDEFDSETQIKLSDITSYVENAKIGEYYLKGIYKTISYKTARYDIPFGIIYTGKYVSPLNYSSDIFIYKSEIINASNLGVVDIYTGRNGYTYYISIANEAVRVCLDEDNDYHIDLGANNVIIDKSTNNGDELINIDSEKTIINNTLNIPTTLRYGPYKASNKEHQFDFVYEDDGTLSIIGI